MSRTREAIAGALLLTRFDKSGLRHFDATVEGFWASFMAAFWVAPIELILWLDSQDSANLGPDALDPVHRFAREVIGYGLQWVAFPFVLLMIVDRLGKRDRYFGYMAAYNWLSVPLMALFLLTRGLGLPEPADLIFADVVFLYTLSVQWFLARHALDLKGWQAVAVVALDNVLGVFIAISLGSG